MSTDNSQPGEARASGPSVADTLVTDSRGVPPPLLQQQYEFLGDSDIPCSRYTSRAFAEELILLLQQGWRCAPGVSRQRICHTRAAGTRRAGLASVNSHCCLPLR